MTEAIEAKPMLAFANPYHRSHGPLKAGQFFVATLCDGALAIGDAFIAS